MSEKNIAQKGLTLAKIDAAHIVDICGDAARTEKLVAWMDELINENIALMSDLSESMDEGREVRYAHWVSQISVYRRIKDAANSALDSTDGQPPPDGEPEPAEGDPL